MTNKNNAQPIINPIPIGISTEKFSPAIALKYTGYTPRHINIKVLLTPGTTTPTDISIPASTKNPLEKFVASIFMFILFSIITNIYPHIKVIIVNTRYLSLNLCSEFTFFISIGMLPSINPMKQKETYSGNFSNSVCSIFPNKNTPSPPPQTIGKRYVKFSLKFLNSPNIEFINLSYIPSITHITPLLIPGSIAPAPSSIPVKNL